MSPKRRPLWAYVVAVALIGFLAVIGNKGKQNAHHAFAQARFIG